MRFICTPSVSGQKSDWWLHLKRSVHDEYSSFMSSQKIFRRELIGITLLFLPYFIILIGNRVLNEAVEKLSPIPRLFDCLHPYPAILDFQEKSSLLSACRSNASVCARQWLRVP